MRNSVSPGSFFRQPHVYHSTFIFYQYLIFIAAGAENPHSHKQEIGNANSTLIAFMFNKLYPFDAPIPNSGIRIAGNFTFKDASEETTYPVKYLYFASEKYGS